MIRANGHLPKQVAALFVLLRSCVLNIVLPLNLIVEGFLPLHIKPFMCT